MIGRFATNCLSRSPWCSTGSSSRPFCPSTDGLAHILPCIFGEVKCLFRSTLGNFAAVVSTLANFYARFIGRFETRFILAA